MLDTIWTSDFTNALVVPFDDTYDRTRNILEHLQQLVDVYPFIRSAFLYCPTSQMVYGSDLTYQPVEEASNELFQNPEHLLSYSGARLSKSHTSFFIKQLTGKTIICQHLYPDYLDSLGALIIELDLASFPLSSIFNPESSSRLPCFITDTNGLPIFRGELPSSLASLFPLAALSSVPAQTVLYAQNGLTYFYHRSSFHQLVLYFTNQYQPTSILYPVVSNHPVLHLRSGMFGASFCSNRIQGQSTYPPLCFLRLVLPLVLPMWMQKMKWTTSPKLIHIPPDKTRNSAKQFRASLRWC